KTNAFNYLLKYAPYLQPITDIISEVQKNNQKFFDEVTFLKLKPILNQIQQNNFLPVAVTIEENEIRNRINFYIEGNLIGPIIVYLGMNGLFHKYFMESNFKAEEFHKDPDNFEIILNYLSYLGWFIKKNNHYSFTEKGLFFARRATSYGVTVSYLPMLSQMQHLLFG